MLAPHTQPRTAMPKALHQALHACPPWHAPRLPACHKVMMVAVGPTRRAGSPESGHVLLQRPCSLLCVLPRVRGLSGMS